MLAGSLVQQELDHRHDAADDSQDDQRVTEAQCRAFYKAKGNAAQADGDENHAGDAHAPRRFAVEALRHPAQQHNRGANAQRNMDEENQPPHAHIGEDAGEEGRQARHQHREARPQAQRPALTIAAEVGGDYRQAVGHNHGAADALRQTPGNDDIGGCRQAANGGRQAKEQNPQQADAVAPVVIAQRAGDDNQRCLHHDIGVRNPDEVCAARAQLTLDGWQRHIQR